MKLHIIYGDQQFGQLLARMKVTELGHFGGRVFNFDGCLSITVSVAAWIQKYKILARTFVQSI